MTNTGGEIQAAQAKHQVTTDAEVRADDVSAADIRMKACDWLWEEDGGKWLPKGEFCLLAGREGLGKSTLAYGLIARITRGTLPGHDYGKPKSVVVHATEEDWGASINPRLAASGADMTRVYPKGPLSLPDDLEELEDFCGRKDVALIFVDPLISILGRQMKSNEFTPVQHALEELVNLGHRQNLTVLGVAQLNKSMGTDMISRIMGSRAFASVSRSILMVIREGWSGDRETFLFGQEKNSYGPRPHFMLRYEIEAEEVGRDSRNDRPIIGQRVVFTEKVEGTVQEVASNQEKTHAGQNSARSRAAEWLKAFLQERGETPSADVKTAAAGAGHSPATLKRAMEAAGVTSVPVPGSKERVWALGHGSPGSQLRGVPQSHDLIPEPPEEPVKSKKPRVLRSRRLGDEETGKSKRPLTEEEDEWDDWSFE